jgi:hypothetical protein
LTILSSRSVPSFSTRAASQIGTNWSDMQTMPTCYLVDHLLFPVRSGVIIIGRRVFLGVRYLPETTQDMLDIFFSYILACFSIALAKNDKLETTT